MPADLDVYAAAGEARQPGSSGKFVRGLALYYHFAGNTEMVAHATQIREEKTAKQRRVFPLKEFRGVDPAHIEKLAAAGVINVEQMLAAGATPVARQQLAGTTGIPEDTILELVKLSDLSRLAGLKGIRARLYHDAGMDTVEKIAAWEPEELRATLAEFVVRTGFEGIAPLPKEVQNVVATARSLPRIVEYQEAVK
jgi:predicted flap endonuclease-1-like 5' DNA nuclease